MPEGSGRPGGRGFRGPTNHQTGLSLGLGSLRRSIASSGPTARDAAASTEQGATPLETEALRRARRQLGARASDEQVATVAAGIMRELEASEMAPGSMSLQPEPIMSSPDQALVDPELVGSGFTQAEQEQAQAIETAAQAHREVAQQRRGRRGRRSAEVDEKALGGTPLNLTDEQKKALESAPGQYDPIEAFYEMGAKGSRTLGMAERDAQNEIASVVEALNAQRQEAFARFQEDYEEQRAREEEALAQVQETTQRLIDTPFDANQLFNNNTGAENFGLALGVAVGSVIQTVLNSQFPGLNAPNMAKRMIDEAIERDVQTQVQSFNQLSAGADAAQSAYSTALRHGLSQREAQDFLLLKQVEMAKDEMFIIARRFRGTRAGVMGEQLAAEYEAKVAQLKQQLEASRMTAAAARPGGASGGGTRYPAPAGYRWDPNTETDAATRREGRERVLGSTEAITQARNILRILREGRDFETLAGFGGQRAMLEQMWADLVIAYVQGSGLGSYDEGLANLVKKGIPDPTSSTTNTGTLITALESFVRTQSRRRSADATAFGLTRTADPDVPETQRGTTFMERDLAAVNDPDARRSQLESSGVQVTTPAPTVPEDRSLWDRAVSAVTGDE